MAEERLVCDFFIQQRHIYIYFSRTWWSYNSHKEEKNWTRDNLKDKEKKDEIEKDVYI